MKNKIKSLLAGAAMLATGVILMATAGCVPLTSNKNIVLVKSTVLGFDVSADAQSQVPHVRIGLIRNQYQVIPVSTNEMFAPSFTTSVNAKLGLTSQYANEDYASGTAADQLTGSTNYNSVAKIGASDKLTPPVTLPGIAQPAKPATP